LLISPVLWSTIQTVTAVQIQGIHPFFNSIQLDRHPPSRCYTPFFVWKTILRSLLFNITFTIQPPADTTNATTVSPSLQAVRVSQSTLSTFMASKIYKADLFALTIPAERVTLRIANAAVVPSTFTTFINTAHRLPTLRRHRPPMCPQQMDGVNLLQHPLVRLLPIIQKTKIDLTAPAAEILQRLATRQPNSTPHQPRFSRLLP
jgi:hypothetical protein